MDTMRIRYAPGRAGAVIRLLLMAGCLTVLVAACSRPGAQSAGQSRQQQVLQQAVAYSKCMRSHGVSNYPDPQSQSGTIRLGPGNSIDPNSPQFIAAAQACHKLQPGPGSMSPQQIAQARSDGLKTANCMHRHGFPNFPDPNSQGVISLQPGDGVDTNSPQFQSALTTCVQGSAVITLGDHTGAGGGAPK